MKELGQVFQKLPYLITFYLFVAGVVIVGVTKISYKYYFNQGVHAYNRGDYKKATQWFKKSIEAKPNSPQTKFCYVVSLIAIEELTQPNLLRKSGRESEAIKVLEDIINKSTNFEEIDKAYYYIAGIYNKLNEKEKYRDYIFKRAELEKQTLEVKAEIYYRLGVSYWNEVNIIIEKYQIKDKYLVQYQSATKWEPQDIEQVKKSAQIGLKYIEMSMKLNPKYYNNYVYKGLLKKSLVSIELDEQYKIELKDPCIEIGELYQVNREYIVK